MSLFGNDTTEKEYKAALNEMQSLEETALLVEAQEKKIEIAKQITFYESKIASLKGELEILEG